jgi:photosystem II stability/assembly factor-like uncharacterized protein
VGDGGALVRIRGVINYGTTNPSFNFAVEPIEPVTPDDLLFDVEMLTADQGWAVGGTLDTRGIVLQYTEGTWSVFQIIDSYLTDLYMLSANDGWAVGDNGTILHYTGGTWSSVASPTTALLRKISMVSASEGWIIGDGGAILHYDGTSWSPVSYMYIDAYNLLGLDFTSGTGWAVGDSFDWIIGGVIMKYLHGEWVCVTAPTANQLNDVFTVSETDAWAVGDADSLGPTLVHWDGEVWRRYFQTTPPLPAANLYTVYMTSSDNGWAMGEAIGSPPASFILHWDGTRWLPPRFQSPINVDVSTVSMILSTYGFAVGRGDQAIMNYDNRGGGADYWEGLPTCHDYEYDMLGISTVISPTGLGWDGWSVGRNLSFICEPNGFVHFEDCAAAGNKWVWIHPTCNCGCGHPDDWGGGAEMRGIWMVSPDRGWAAGQAGGRATFYWLGETDWWAAYDWEPYYWGWDDKYCAPSSIGESAYNDVFAASEPITRAWMVGYRSDFVAGRHDAWITHYDPTNPYLLDTANILPRWSLAPSTWIPRPSAFRWANMVRLWSIPIPTSLCGRSRMRWWCDRAARPAPTSWPLPVEGRLPT